MYGTTASSARTAKLPTWRTSAARRSSSGLIGCPVAHSLSPRMQNAAFTAAGLDWVYVPLPTLGRSGWRRLYWPRPLLALGTRANVSRAHKLAGGARLRDRGGGRLGEHARRQTATGFWDRPRRTRPSSRRGPPSADDPPACRLPRSRRVNGPAALRRSTPRTRDERLGTTMTHERRPDRARDTRPHEVLFRRCGPDARRPALPETETAAAAGRGATSSAVSDPRRPKSASFER